MGLDHEPDRPARASCAARRADLVRCFGPVATYDVARRRAAAVGGLDRIPVDHEDIRHAVPRCRLAGMVEVRDVAEDGDDRMVRVGLLEGRVDRADLSGVDPVPGRFLDGQVAPQRGVVLQPVDGGRDARRIDRPARNRGREVEDHLDAADGRRVEELQRARRAVGVLDDVAERPIADPVPLRGQVEQRDVLEGHRRAGARGRRLARLGDRVASDRGARDRDDEGRPEEESRQPRAAEAGSVRLLDHARTMARRPTRD